MQEHVRGRLFSGRGQPVRVGRFVVLRRLGSGGMGVVYAARDDELQRDIAVKLLRPTRDDEGSRQRLLQEAQAMARLSHPNVVTVHEVGEHDGQVYMAMELVHGVTLRTWAQAQPRSWRQVLAVMLQAARGIAAAHEIGIVHRDIKPENILIGPSRDRAVPRVWIVDFLPPSAGDSQSKDSLEPRIIRLDERLAVTETGALVGTPAYMAPEQWEGRPADARSDQYAFCVTFCEALYGQRPDSDDTGAQGSAPRLSPVSTDRRAPTWLRRVLARGLRPKPQQRWPSMAALVEALQSDPTARRRWIATLGLAALTVAGIMGVRRWHEQRVSERCNEQANRLVAEAWGDEHRESIVAAFAAIDHAHAPDTARLVRERLDDYAESWQQQRVAVCLDTGHDRALPDEIELRNRCLDHRRMSLAALAAVLADADDGVAFSATSAAARLPPLEPCEAPDRIRKLLPSRLSPEHEAIAAALTRAFAFGTTHQRAKAASEAQEALSRARELGAAGLVAAAQLQLGMWGRNDLPELFENAFHSALSHGLDAVALECTVALVSHHWYRNQFEPAHRWADMGRTLVERTGHTEPLLELELDHQIANLIDEEGDQAAATRLLAEVVRRAETMLGLDHPRTLLFRSSYLAVRSGGFQHDPLLGAELSALVDAQTKVYGPAHPDVAKSLVNLAHHAAYSGQCERAESAARRALTLDVDAFGSDHPAVAHDLYTLARSLRCAGDHQGSLDAARQAQEILETTGVDRPTFMFNLKEQALALRGLGRFDEAEQRIEQARELFSREWGPRHSATLEMRYWLGSIQRAKHELDRAVESFETVVASEESSPFSRAEAASALAEILASRGDEPERARQLALEALDDYATFGVLHFDEMAEIALWLEAHPV